MWVNAPFGVKLAVLPLTTTVPLTFTPPELVLRVNVALVKVAFVMASEKVAETDAFGVTSDALFAGEIAETVGGVVSGLAAVVNVQEKLLERALPAASSAPVVTMAR